MKGNLQVVLDRFVFDDEGEEFEVRSTEPGGAVKLGVSFATLVTWWKLKGKGKPTFNDLKSLTRADAASIYDDLYWRLMRGDEFKSGVDYAVFDPVMNSGLTGGINILQAALGHELDGHLTLELINEANSFDAPELIDRICDARLAYMKTRPTWQKNKGGWIDRVARVRERAKSMLP